MDAPVTGAGATEEAAGGGRLAGAEAEGNVGNGGRAEVFSGGDGNAGAPVFGGSAFDGDGAGGKFNSAIPSAGGAAQAG